MAVVINEFEVAPAVEPPAKRGADSSSTSAPPPEKPKEDEIEKMMARHAERYERVWAH